MEWYRQPSSNKGQSSGDALAATDPFGGGEEGVDLPMTGCHLANPIERGDGSVARRCPRAVGGDGGSAQRGD